MANIATKTEEQIIAGDFNINLSKSIGYSQRFTYKGEAWDKLKETWVLKDPVEIAAKKTDVYPMTYIHTTENKGEENTKYPLKAARLDGIFMTADVTKYEVKIGKFLPL